jgi:hypothetical protein
MKALTGARVSVSPKSSAGYVHVKGSDGSQHYIPKNQIKKARKLDPKLTIVGYVSVSIGASASAT